MVRGTIDGARLRHEPDVIRRPKKYKPALWKSLPRYQSQSTDSADFAKPQTNSALSSTTTPTTIPTTESKSGLPANGWRKPLPGSFAGGSRKKRLRPRSKRYESKMKVYRVEVAAWLALPANQFCLVAKLLGWGRIRADQNHHRRGRNGSLLMDKRFWTPVSFRGHDWIGNNIAAARKLGLICEKGLWNTPDRT